MVGLIRLRSLGFILRVKSIFWMVLGRVVGIRLCVS